tara:strand:- start:907 stop:1647 length:741 start_codon:yes stop_codon:yes gene_type:complete
MAKKIHITRGAIITNVASTKKYMQELKQFESLTKAEEIELALAAQSGCQSSYNKLITNNLRFVAQVAKQYQGMGVDLEDLIAFGNLGLFEALEKFDTSKNFKFITFAVWYIRSEIQKALNDLGRTVRVPSHKTQTEKQYITSIHKPVGEESNAETYADRYLKAEPMTSDRELKDMRADILRILAKLPEKQRIAITMFYGIGCEFESCMERIAEELNVTGERARQLVRQAEKSLRAMEDIDLLKQYS